MERAPNSKMKSNPSSDFEMICFKLNPIFKWKTYIWQCIWLRLQGHLVKPDLSVLLENTAILLLCITSKCKKKRKTVTVLPLPHWTYLGEKNCIIHDSDTPVYCFLSPPHYSIEIKVFKNVFSRMDIFSSHFQSFSIVFPQTMSLKMSWLRYIPTSHWFVIEWYNSVAFFKTSKQT